jgi:excisionase family DNA binding protein
MSRFGTRKEAALFARLTVSTIDRWIATGVIPATRIGGRRLVDLDKLDWVIDSASTGPVIDLCRRSRAEQGLPEYVDTISMGDVTSSTMEAFITVREYAAIVTDRQPGSLGVLTGTGLTAPP